jgi:hypothetical protein
MTKDEAEAIGEALTKLERGQTYIAADLLRLLLRRSGHQPPPPVLVSTRDEPADSKHQSQ